MPLYAYLMTNRQRTLYVGMTGDLERRVLEHKAKLIRGFTRKYDITQLVWFQEFYSAEEAISAEKKIKGWLRSKKIALIEAANPDWKDLAADLSAGSDKMQLVILNEVENLASRQTLRSAQGDESR